MAVAGAIAKNAQQLAPITWAALEEDRRYGEEYLQGRVDLVKYKVFGEVIPATAEASTYDPIVLDYVGKLVVIELARPGADFWASQASSFSAQGRNEVKMYGDRAKALRELRDELVAETRGAWEDIQGRLGITLQIRRRSKGIRVGVPNDEVLITPSPDKFERPFVLPAEDEVAAEG
jgi:hypothetical protein